MLCLFVMMCLCQYSRCPCRGMQQKFLETGGWLCSVCCLKKKNQIYCPLAICSSQFAALFLHHSATVDFFFFCFSLYPFVPVRLFDWRSRGVKQCWKSERRWMERLKECESEGEWLGLGWLVWVSLGCGGAPLCWMSGRDRIGGSLAPWG